MSRPGAWDPDPIESLVLAMASRIRAGDTWGVGMGTTLPLVALSLARVQRGIDFKVFLPELGAYAVHTGGAASLQPGPRVLTAGATMHSVAVSTVFDEDLGRRYGEYFRPAQLDADGNMNISWLGGSLLVGYAGIAEAMQRYARVYLYTPRHDRRFFVDRVESVTANVRTAAPGVPGPRVCTVLTNLGVFELVPERRALQVRYLYPGVALADVEDATAMTVRGTSPVAVQPPEPELLSLLRDVVDPERLRDREAAGRTAG